MAADYLHNHRQFSDLLNIVADKMSIDPYLVEKDYWIMNVLYGLKLQGFSFELKGGTSLSKGFGIIQRFSEDIDIHISPPPELNVNATGQKPNAINSRRSFYDWLNENIAINGIIGNARDKDFDNLKTYTSGGIRLHYKTLTQPVAGLKEGILLEAGFDTVAPNQLVDISSWAYDHASGMDIDLVDNRAMGIACYNPGYTFVEKLQTIVTKYRKELEGGSRGVNFMRQYYDVYCLLANPEVVAFIGTEEYHAHKEKRFPAADKLIPLQSNQAFILDDQGMRGSFIQRYKSTAGLYYNGQPDFETLLKGIGEHLHLF
ncbi:MAG: nucleotidyl transferase AbiEii/AbiGii toxin family protein [Sphingobacteriaceae bacterium]|nr:MAG: nucleotidyl transferase AbiEii/AbiGii toxin family protein [Sphingobacteriaceae bacterium]